MYYVYINVIFNQKQKKAAHQEELLSVDVDEVVLGGRDQGRHILCFFGGWAVGWVGRLDVWGGPAPRHLSTTNDSIQRAHPPPCQSTWPPRPRRSRRPRAASRSASASRSAPRCVCVGGMVGNRRNDKEPSAPARPPACLARSTDQKSIDRHQGRSLAYPWMLRMKRECSILACLRCLRCLPRCPPSS